MIVAVIKFLFLVAIAHANKNTPLVSPGLTDDHFWLTHYQEIQVWLGGQVVIFGTWVGVQVYNSFIKSKDKTADRIEQILEAQFRMQEDLKNIKYSMVSKAEAHDMIQSEIKYANELRGQ